MAAAALASALPVIALAEAAVQAAPRTSGAGSSATGSTNAKAAEVPATGPLQLKVRRLSDSVELVIEGAGMAPQLQQSSGANGWQGLLTTAAPSGLRVGTQRLSMPELGFQTITLDGSGSSYRVGVTPVAGAPLGRPVVSGDGINMIISFPASAQVSLPVARFNARQPGYIPQATFAPPLQPRAVAPPLGDMAVGSMTLRNPGYLNLSGPAVTMTLKNAPAKDALMALAQVGGYGFAYVAEADAANPSGGVDAGSARISLAFRGESYGRAFNTALLAAGLQGRREGNMILAGPKALSKGFGPQLSKVYRLNQVGPIAAADYLASLGATVTRVDTITTSVSQGVSESDDVKGAPSTQTTETAAKTFIEEYQATTGPLIGLRATTDIRLGTITIVGSPDVVAVAEQYLKQLDLRQRQVALSVRILDVNLDNVSEIDNSFAFRWGNNFIVSDNGQLLGAFGSNLPPNANAFRRDSDSPLESLGASTEQSTTTNRGVQRGLSVNRAKTLSLTDSQIQDVNNELQQIGGFKLETLDEGQRLEIVQIDGSSTNIANSDKRSIERVLTRVSGRTVTTDRAFDRATNASRTKSSDISGTRRPNPGSFYEDNTFE